MAHHEVNARRLLCPMPVIKSQNIIKQCQNNDTVTVAATDPGALQDVPTWCRISGHELIEAIESDGEFRITFKVHK